MTNQRSPGGDLRSMLRNADAESDHAMPVPHGLNLGMSSLPAMELTSRDMIPVPRMPIMKVQIKTEVAAFIERHFMSRTSADGTILGLSKENLVEHLTGLFHSLEQQSAEVGERFPKTAKAKQPAAEDHPQR